MLMPRQCIVTIQSNQHLPAGVYNMQGTIEGSSDLAPAHEPGLNTAQSQISAQAVVALRTEL